MSYRHRFFPLITALAFIAVLLLAGCDLFREGSGEDKVRVTVMTRNLYLGGDLFALLEAESSADAIARASALYATVQATDFPARAGRLAAEIEAAAPALVGLQEVTLYRTEAPSDFLANLTPDAEDVRFDFLQILQDSLDARGMRYRVAAQTEGTDEELPVQDANGALLDVRLTDRDVILARADVSTAGARSKRYAAAAQFVVGGVVPIAFVRSYNQVEATIGGVTFTFVNTHLEVGGEAAPVQEAQAAELIADLSTVDGPVVLVGDFNSPADGSGTASYAALTSSGFTDAFAATHPDADGFTCCQADDLTNEASLLDTRIDFVLYRGAVTAPSVEVVGEEQANKTPGGLWPSDHAGVVAALEIAE